MFDNFSLQIPHSTRVYHINISTTMEVTFLVALLLIGARSGPLAPGAWTACVAACSSVAWNPVLFGICWAACGPGSSLACFADTTTITTQKGVILLKDASIGDYVLTSNLNYQK